MATSKRHMRCSEIGSNIKPIRFSPCFFLIIYIARKEMTQGQANSRNSPLLSHLSAPLARMAGAPVPQLGGFPDSAQLALLILSLGQASNWVIQSGNIQAKWSCALLIHSCAFRGHQPTKD